MANAGTVNTNKVSPLMVGHVKILKGSAQSLMSTLQKMGGARNAKKVQLEMRRGMLAVDTLNVRLIRESSLVQTNVKLVVLVSHPSRMGLNVARLWYVRNTSSSRMEGADL